MKKNNLNTFIEVGPGQVLKKLNKKITNTDNTTTFEMVNLDHENIN
jgi:malonyl CoA-acyl carrier protein transacylase